MVTKKFGFLMLFGVCACIFSPNTASAQRQQHHAARHHAPRVARATRIARSARPAQFAPAAPERLDLRSAILYALAHSPALLAKQADLIGLIATFTKQRATQYPSITAELENQLQASQNASGSLAQFGIAPQPRFSLNTAQIASQWTLYNGSLNQILTQQDRRKMESAGADLQRDEEQIVGDTAGAFYDLAAQAETTALAETDERYQRRLLDVTRTAQHAGREAGVDVLRARVQTLRAHAAVITARTDERNAQEKLALRIGAPPDTVFVLPSRVPQPAQPQQSLAELTAKALAQRPEGAAARADLAFAQLAESAVDTDLKPTVTLSGAFGSQVSPTDFVYQQQQIDAQNAAAAAQYQLERQLAPTANIPPPLPLPPVSRRQSGFWQLGATEHFGAPILDYGQRATAHHAARAQILAASVALANARYIVEVDVRQALRNLQSDAENLDLAQRSDALASQSARIAQLQFKHGLISFTDVSQTEQTAVAAHTDLLKARTAYAAAYIYLRVALGYSGIDAV